MTTDLVHRGMQLAAERPEVMLGEAGQDIQALYEDIQRSLRVPIVNLIFRTLANDPDYLQPAWRRIASVVRTRGFEAAADQLRAAALLQPAPDASGIAWDNTGPVAKIRAFNDTIHYVLPKLLLIATAWDKSDWGAKAAGDQSAIPLGVAPGAEKDSMVKQEDVSPRVRQLLEREKSAHGHPLATSYYRVLANWPDFLELIWNGLEPVVVSEGYLERRQQLVQLATDAVARLPLAGDLKDLARTEEISQLLGAFRRNFVPSMMIDAGLIKSMVDGEAAARSSPFSVA